jgi:hypothetical protein
MNDGTESVDQSMASNFVSDVPSHSSISSDLGSKIPTYLKVGKALLLRQKGQYTGRMSL